MSRWWEVVDELLKTDRGPEDVRGLGQAGVEGLTHLTTKPWKCPSCGRVVKVASCKTCRVKRPEVR